MVATIGRELQRHWVLEAKVFPGIKRQRERERDRGTASRRGTEDEGLKVKDKIGT